MQELETMKKYAYAVGYVLITIVVLVIVVKKFIAKRRKRNNRIAPVAFNKLMQCMSMKKIRYNPDEEND